MNEATKEAEMEVFVLHHRLPHLPFARVIGVVGRHNDDVIELSIINTIKTLWDSGLLCCVTELQHIMTINIKLSLCCCGSQFFTQSMAQKRI
jgi:hypothetical protein